MPGIAHHHQQPNIWLAASEGRTADVEAALKSGGINGAPMDPNAHDENGYTALHAAASYAHLDLIQLLLTKFGADANVTDFDGDTPLHVTETVDAAKMLIDLGADPTQRNNAGRLVGRYACGNALAHLALRCSLWPIGFRIREMQGMGALAGSGH
ncbi:ankyrin repeat-containing domain protein [Entophlyctis helioformis]|nr:ankyrin repeat-containing domain protein [Entophlyctis helioformis]